MQFRYNLFPVKLVSSSWPGQAEGNMLGVPKDQHIQGIIGGLEGLVVMLVQELPSL